MKDFNIYLTFDIDQDFNPDGNDYYNRSEASFKTFNERFSELIDRLNGLPFSVFIRSDYQIKSIYGSYDYLINYNTRNADKIVSSGGEINWHIHLYKKEKDEWIQIINENETSDRFISDYNEVKKTGIINTGIVRVGECIMNNTLMKAMSDLGIKIDSTALPGRKRNDKEKFFDWSLTANRFYNPSKRDYRIESTDNYSVVEVPMTTMKMKADYDTEAFKRYFNLSFKTEVLFQDFDNYLDEHNSLVIITHPFEVLFKGTHGLISYDINTFENNLKLLKEKILSHGMTPVFNKISSIVL